jgi:multicomponent K+:H+ antiporter subunit E
MIRRAFPHPLLSLLLALAWLLLQRSVVLPQLITAAVLGIGLPLLLGGVLPAATRLARAQRVPAFAARVLWDIVVANLTVARIVLDPRARPQPAWVPVPLQLTQPTAVSLLATIITTTPGTVSCIVDDERHQILVHALDCADPAALAADIQARYEQPLREIFGP